MPNLVFVGIDCEERDVTVSLRSSDGRHRGTLRMGTRGARAVAGALDACTRQESGDDERELAIHAEFETHTK